MTHDQFFKNIKSGALARVYFFYGVEQHIKRSALEALRQKLLPDGFEALNESVLEGATAAQIIEAAETLPFMCDKRLVVVYDWAPLMSGKSRDEANEAERMSGWLPSAPESCCLVFFMRESADKRKKMTAALEKLAESVEFPLLDDAGVLKWANQQLRPLGKEIDRDAVTRLTFMAGYALVHLGQELNKLAAYTGDRSRITKADVDAIVTPSTECTVYQMIDAVLAHKPLEAQRLLKSRLEAGEDCVGILARLTGQMRRLTHMRLMRAQGVPLPEIERALELNHYAAQRSSQQAAKFSPQALEAGYRACVEADFAIKSGRKRQDIALDEILFLLNNMT